MRSSMFMALMAMGLEVAGPVPAFAQTDTAPPAATTGPSTPPTPPARPLPPPESAPPPASPLPSAPATASQPGPPAPSDPTSLLPTAPATAPMPASWIDTRPPEAPRSAGYHNGSFYVRSQDDVFRLYILARVHADWLGQFGPGTSSIPSGSGITNGFYLRRARLELAGEFFQTWQWQVGAEFSSSTSVDNAAAQQTTPTCVPNATGAAPCTNKENAVDNATVKPIPTDVFVNYAPSPWGNLEVGQFYLPFTMENRISDNTTAFLERSLAVRNIGAPLQRDIGAMLWGESPNRMFYYAVAVLNGDGPNRANPDSRYDWALRAFVRPAAGLTESPTKWAQIGVSAKLGSRDSRDVGYDLPALTTQGGFAFWKPTYTDSLKRVIHIIPSSTQWGIAGDVYLPIGKFDFTGELIYNSYDTREAVDGFQISPFTERTGNLKGVGGYAQVDYWIFGDHTITGYPSYGRPIHVDFNQPQVKAQQGLQALAKFDWLALTYDGASRSGKLDSKTPDGSINVSDVELGLSYWATKHLRVGLNYTHYWFPSAAPVSPSFTGGPQQFQGSQRAVSPAQTLAVGTDNAARSWSGTLEELQARVGVQF